jgi:MerR family transcriptional regulator, heat shock protein HspR
VFTEDEPVFAIAQAAELAAMHPQTLRQYDRLGLVTRSERQGRSRYSMRDIVQLREVQRLSNEGLNLEGIRRILELENTVTDLGNQRVRELESLLADAMIARPVKPSFCRRQGQARSSRFEPVPRSQKSNQVELWRRSWWN